MRIPLLIGGAALALGAAALPAMAADLTPKLPFEKITLDNGLEVILSEDHRVPLVSVNIWYHVGAKNEVPGRSGFAHLFEHIMFQGSRNVAEDTFFQHLEGAGAPLVNGTTDFDRTNYFETVPSNQLDLALWLESDRMGFLLDTLTQERLDNQKAVVRKERQQSTENVPYGVAEERFFQLLFPAPHPYNGVVIGSHADLEAASLEDVKGFFQKWYVPNNATLAIVGDFDPAEIKAKVNKYFGSIPKGAEPDSTPPQAKAPTKEIRESLTDEVELSKLYLGWVTPNSFQAGDAELQLAALVMADGKSSRLHEELVMKKQIATEVAAYQYPLQAGSVFGVTVLGRPGVSAQALEDAAWPLIEVMGRAMVRPEELTRAKNTWAASTLRGLESLGGFGGKADLLNFYNHHLGDPDYLSKDFARFTAVTPRALQQAVGTYLQKDNRVVVHVAPKAGGAK
jgi:zinc protease